MRDEISFIVKVTIKLNYTKDTKQKFPAVQF